MDIFANQIAQLEQGYAVYDAFTKQTVLIRGTLLLTISDSRAHHKLTNFSTSLAIIGACPCCEIEGERYAELKTTIYGGFARWRDNNHKPMPRTHENICEDINEAKDVFPTPSGIKGVDAISPVLPDFDIVRQNVLCIMHILCSTIKDIYKMLGNEGNKKEKNNSARNKSCSR